MQIDSKSIQNVPSVRMMHAKGPARELDQVSLDKKKCMEIT